MIIKVNYHDLYFEYKKRFWNLPRDLYPYVDGLTIDQNTERRLERYLFDLVRKEIEEMFKVKNEDIEIDSMGRSTYGWFYNDVVQFK